MTDVFVRNMGDRGTVVTLRSVAFLYFLKSLKGWVICRQEGSWREANVLSDLDRGTLERRMLHVLRCDGMHPRRGGLGNLLHPRRCRTSSSEHHPMRAWRRGYKAR